MPSPPATAGRGRLARSAGIIGIATIASRILGLARDQVIAFFFGAGNATDAFNVAFRIPNLLRDLFAEGAMTAAFVPTFTRYLTLKDKDDAWRLGNHVINALVVATGILAVFGMVFAEPLTRFYAGQYAAVPGKLELTITLTRVMFPFLMLVAIAAACMGMLNSLHRFFVPALSPAMFNVGTIVCAVMLVPMFTRLHVAPIMAIAIGTLVGGLGQIVIQWPLLRREGFRYRMTLDPKDEGLRQMLALMAPATVGLAAVQVNILVNTWLATGLGTGRVTWLQNAFRLMYMPIGLFGVSVATAAIPALSRHAAEGDLGQMRNTISSGIRMMLMLNVPATFGLIVLAQPIIAMLFQYGKFDAVATQGTAAALVFYSPGLIGYSAVKIAAPSFYALQNSRTPVVVSMATMALNIVLNLMLIRVLGYRGLALGTAASALFNAVTLMVLLRRRLGGIDGPRVSVAFAKITVASVVMAFAAYETNAWLDAAVPGQYVLLRVARVALDIGAALGVLALMARLLHIEEFTQAMRMVFARLMRS